MKGAGLMATPGFMAELALQPTRRTYRLQRPRRDAAGTYGFVPQAGVSGVYIGSTCYNGVQTEVYVDFGDDGVTVTGIHPVGIGSC
jgi:hypothetical protein